MAKKLKKFLKKAGKAALVAGALYAGAKGLGKRKLSKAVSTSDEAGKGVSWYNHPLDNIPRSDLTTVKPDKVFGGGAGFKKGGHVKSMGKATRGGGVAKR